MVTTFEEWHLSWHMRSILACSFDTIHTIEFAEVICMLRPLIFHRRNDYHVRQYNCIKDVAYLTYALPWKPLKIWLFTILWIYGIFSCFFGKYFVVTDYIFFWVGKIVNGWLWLRKWWHIWFFKPFPWQLLKLIVLILSLSKNTFWIISKELTVGSILLISQMKRDIYTVHLIKKYAEYLICIFNHMHKSVIELYN